jgi:hypothetical protein
LQGFGYLLSLCECFLPVLWLSYHLLKPTASDAALDPMLQDITILENQMRCTAKYALTSKRLGAQLTFMLWLLKGGNGRDWICKPTSLLKRQAAADRKTIFVDPTLK